MDGLNKIYVTARWIHSLDDVITAFTKLKREYPSLTCVFNNLKTPSEIDDAAKMYYNSMCDHRVQFDMEDVILLFDKINPVVFWHAKSLNGNTNINSILSHSIIIELPTSGVDLWND